jgi:hypothetical protein
VRQAERDQGMREGLTTSDRERLKVVKNASNALIIVFMLLVSLRQRE